MRFHSGISDQEATDDAVAELIDQAHDALGDAIDVATVFFTEHHREDIEAVIERLWLELDPQCMIGCSGEGVIGGNREIERAPGMSLLVGSLPDVRIQPFHIASESDWRECLSEAQSLREMLGIGPETRGLIAFGDPFSTPLSQLLPTLDRDAAGIPLVGGMASSARRPGQNMLVRNDEVYTQGMVGLSLSGPLKIATVVSQGCRPIGQHMIVTRSHENVIEQLGGKPAMEVLRGVVSELPASDQHLLQNGLFVGQAISEYREQFGRGDYLVRNVIGVDEEGGSISIADYVKTGQTVQFHLRDAQTADEDLKIMLETQKALGPAAGGLLFSCNGRGLRMFDQVCHDIKAAHEVLPATPMAGFFAAGEIGPVGGKNFIHGHTASFALIRPE
ncbi:MAG TPA: FIST N-terminal domain-containing protein [Tepidisphaeraceae bacterium]|nr:FIST N-terminal domain-containing protein [Tepidisphaeraceae bacterium]